MEICLTLGFPAILWCDCAIVWNWHKGVSLMVKKCPQIVFGRHKAEQINCLLYHFKEYISKCKLKMNWSETTLISRPILLSHLILQEYWVMQFDQMSVAVIKSFLDIKVDTKLWLGICLMLQTEMCKEAITGKRK